jgi:hypothetical protein
MTSFKVWTRGAIALALLVGAGAAGADERDDDWPDWAKDQPDLMAQVAAVSDGELRFLPAEAADGKHAHLNRIRISESSLAGGWVTLEQCHENLDAVPAAQILYRADGIRDLTIESSRNIGRAWVEGHSVQLEDVGDDAVLCVRGESQALYDLGDGHFRLREQLNGRQGASRGVAGKAQRRGIVILFRGVVTPPGAPRGVPWRA